MECSSAYIEDLKDDGLAENFLSKETRHALVFTTHSNVACIRFLLTEQMFQFVLPQNVKRPNRICVWVFASQCKVRDAVDVKSAIPGPQSYEQLQQEADSLRQQADDLRREQAEMQRQCVRIKTALARQSERLGRFLRLDQVESLQREEGSSSVRWSEPTLRFALGLYCCSAEAYGRLLAAHWPLPPERDLRTFCRERGVREGVPPQLLQGPSGEQQGNIVWL
ncbi:hypothetical protein HPB48_020970 [Haemaphysalis longicornis]|uniref:Uncharacterized protein n=1 Tax=Haemaphysalis longicornis TaxID=44386 RepID=A0A9J6F6S9_HAELO|nr:hypothetical protein HPB48_020970 [Haemaphysalis longicornis]